MNDSVADIVRQRITDVGLGEESSGDWEVFVSNIPDQPDRAICVYDTLGRFDGRIMRTGEKIEHPGIMVLVRGSIYPETYDRAKAIALALDQTAPFTTVELSSSDVYLIQNISRTGALHPLGFMEDDRRRYHFSINAVLTYRKES